MQSASKANPSRITRGMATVPKNAWYVVAGCEEVGETLLARRVCDVPVVLYRTSGGEVVALLDRCPHRLMPLSLGNRIGDEIQCLYHGLQFGSSGACTKIPSQDFIPKNVCTRRFAVVERGPFVWIWVGDEDKKDPALIPDPRRVKPAYSQYFNLCYEMQADFMLMLENLMDTSHPTFLHAGFFDDGQLAKSKMDVETDGNVVRLTRDIGVHVPGPATTGFFNLDPGKPVYQRTITETYAPALNVIVYQFHYPDQPERERIEFIALAPITPVSDRACYHFVASATSWPTSASAQMNAALSGIIKGDQIAVEAIEERRDGLLPGEAEIHIKGDGASLELRRLIRTMAEEEAVKRELAVEASSRRYA